MAFPEWWDGELELTPHVEKRMEDRRFTEVDLRQMLERASGLRATSSKAASWSRRGVDHEQEACSTLPYLHATRPIEATYAITARERHEAVRYVADRLVPMT